MNVYDATDGAHVGEMIICAVAGPAQANIIAVPVDIAAKRLRVVFMISPIPVPDCTAQMRRQPHYFGNLALVELTP